MRNVVVVVAAGRGCAAGSEVICMVDGVFFYVESIVAEMDHGL